MRRSAKILPFCAILVVACGGCGLFSKKNKTDTYTATTVKDPYAPPAYESSRDYDSVPATYEATTPAYESNESYGSTARSDDNATTQAYNNAYSTPTTMTGTQSTYVPPPATSAVQSSGARYHTVSKGDTLFALARAYYGDQRKWRDIYEANRGDLPDPNMIRTGQRLLIP